MACSNAIHAVALAVATVQPKIKLIGIEHNCWGAFSRLAGVMSSSGSDSDLKTVYMFQTKSILEVTRATQARTRLRLHVGWRLPSL